VLLLSSDTFQAQSKHNFNTHLTFNELQVLILYKLDAAAADDDDEECVGSKQVAVKQFDILFKSFLELSFVVMNKNFTLFFKDYSMKRKGEWSYICSLSSVFSTTFKRWPHSHPVQFTPSTRWVGEWVRP
jgi:hypothetical protein